MIRHYPWQYNDMKQVGIDYFNINEVEVYDKQMAKLRDVKQETKNIIKLLGIGCDDLVAEFGTGTGEFCLEVAKHCKQITGIDVSNRMLEYANEKIKLRGINNVDFVHGSFLTYRHSGTPVDFVITQLALHHLPDFWKQIALNRIYAILKEGGSLYLKDTVYSFDTNKYEHFFEQWISKTKSLAGEELSQDVTTAVREEFSTCDWIMEGLIKRAGFTIQHAEYEQGFLAQYVCKKTGGSIEPPSIIS
ncbi:MAG TPA: class I SAM-dependent methyltransferase [Clostridiales bacterium]|nr:class I SAM-dependent methyltransferase [Clostridiales bacterium]HCS10879.1 class I SAM-dependent methyltransferase [Clostridiales bacterium]